jgi:hypothetical protein
LLVLASISSAVTSSVVIVAVPTISVATTVTTMLGWVILEFLVAFPDVV